MSKTSIEDFKSKEYFWKDALALRLQLFADSEGGEGGNEGGEGGTDGSGQGGKNGSEGGDKNTAKYSDADLDRIISQKLAKWQQKKDAELSEAQRLAQMGAEERAAEYEKKFNELTKKIALGDMTKTARKMLSDTGITIDDELLTMLVTDDAEKTNTAVKSFAALFEAEVQKAVKAALRGEAPKKGSENGLTKEQILAVKNTAERQRLINENMNLFTGGK